MQHAFDRAVIGNQTAAELRLVLEAALEARAKVFPTPQTIPAGTETQVENEESQDYGTFAIDVHDPALDDLLDPPEVKQMRNMDRQLAVVRYITSLSGCTLSMSAMKVSDTWIHSISALIVDFCATTEYTANGSYYQVDAWVNCWVGFANVILCNKAHMVTLDVEQVGSRMDNHPQIVDDHIAISAMV